MALRIYNNLFSTNAQRNLGNNSAALGSSLEKLSSGLRINKAADDAAGLSISEGMRSQIRSMGQAQKNANDGISLINTAEGALAEQSSILVRMRELASQAATGTVGSVERATINREFGALKSEIDRISAVTEFNGQKLIDGSLSASATTSVVVQVGIRATSNDRINFNAAVDLTAITTAGLAITNTNTLTAASALQALSPIDSAISKVTDGRGRLGAVQNRLIHTLGNLAVASENLTADESQVRDAD